MATVTLGAANFEQTVNHTPQPVLVGAVGPGAAVFQGYQDNTDFGKHLHQLIRGK